MEDESNSNKSNLQSAVVDREAVKPEYALHFAWDRKMRAASDACAAQRISFIPLPVETFGGWHPDAALQITGIGRELARSPSGADHKTVIKHYFERSLDSKRQWGSYSKPTFAAQI